MAKSHNNSVFVVSWFPDSTFLFNSLSLPPSQSSDCHLSTQFCYTEANNGLSIFVWKITPFDILTTYYAAFLAEMSAFSLPPTFVYPGTQQSSIRVSSACTSCRNFLTFWETGDWDHWYRSHRRFCAGLKRWCAYHPLHLLLPFFHTVLLWRLETPARGCQ